MDAVLGGEEGGYAGGGGGRGDEVELGLRGFRGGEEERGYDCCDGVGGEEGGEGGGRGVVRGEDGDGGVVYDEGGGLGGLVGALGRGGRERRTFRLRMTTLCLP